MRFMKVSRCCHAAISLLVAAVLCGCASRGPMVGGDRLIVDEITSDQVKLNSIYVHQTGEGVEITGQARFRKAVMGIPLDHITVTVIDSEGAVLYSKRARYYRHGKPTRKYQIFNFSLTIPMTISKGTRVRLGNEAGSLRPFTRRAPLK